MTVMIEARGLSKSFGLVRAVDGVSLQIPAGEIYGLVGSDGAGKTTTMRLLVGALRADSGSCFIGGIDVRSEPERARAQVGYLSQRFSLYEDLTVLENIRFFAEVRGLRAHEWLPRCMDILDFVGLAPYKDRLAGRLSGGMRQKLGLASALVARPRVLLLDEPTTGVDPVTRQDFWQLVISLVSEGATSSAGKAPDEDSRVAVLISTPYMDEAARCHRVGFMRMGKLIAQDSPSQLRSRLSGRIYEVRGSPLAILRRVADADEAVEAAEPFGDRLHVRVRSSRPAGFEERLSARVRAGGGTLDGIRLVQPLLEDVFIELAEGSNA